MRVFFFLALLISQSVCAQEYNGFDLSNSLIDKKDIVQGGPPRDGIPSISSPNYVGASDADFINDNDIVLGLTIAGNAYAYPRHIMNWHEIVNDEIEDQAFVVTYCPLCGSGLAFSSYVEEQKLSFGVSGLLYNNDLIFYDNQTESLWSQIEKRSIAGKLVGEKLEQLYLEHTTWSVWRDKHPNSKVLSEDQGFKRNYRHDPYTGYDTSSQVFFKTLRQTPNEYHTKEKVLGVEVGELSKAYPFSELRANGLANFEDTLGDMKYRVVWNADAQSATIESLGNQVITPTVAFWFAWYNFHPESVIFKADND